MPEGGFLERGRISPTSLTIVILLHGATLTALALSKMDMPVMKVFKPLPIQDFKDPPPPPVEVPPEPKQQPEIRPKSQIDYVPPVVPDLPRTPAHVDVDPTPRVLPFDPGPIGQDVIPKIDPPRIVPPPPAEPVRVEARMLSSSELQPSYPSAEEREGNEGKVSVRVTIGTNGRVMAVEKVSATSDLFFRATERHALRAWRFKPATVDGKPVESSKVISVTFRLND